MYYNPLIALKEKYSASRVWTQATENYGFYTYPHSYYDELVEIVLRSYQV